MNTILLIVALFFVVCVLVFLIVEKVKSEHFKILPIPYAIPDEYIVSNIPRKKRTFSELVPGDATTYKYGLGQEDEYHQQYRESRFAHTRKKGGWDCLRHYEILANGCIPYFENLEDCPIDTMVSFPKDLLKEAYDILLPWKETEEHAKIYDSYVTKLLKHCQAYCSTSALSGYFLTNVPPSRKILMLIGDSGANYTRELLAISLRRKYESDFIEFPKLDILYKGFDPKNSHGYGFTYSNKFSDDLSDRSRIPERISDHEFDIIIYGKVGRDEGPIKTQLPFFDQVRNVYKPEEIIFLYGGDECQNIKENINISHLSRYGKYGTCFVRELIKPQKSS